MWRAARALISWCYTTLGGASSPDKVSNNVNNINDLKFYYYIRGNLKNAIIGWNYLYLTQKLAEAESDERRQALLMAVRHGSVVTWQHINLHGE